MAKKIGIEVLAFIILVGLVNCSGGNNEQAAPAPSPSPAAIASTTPRPSPSPSLVSSPLPMVSSQPTRTKAKVVEVVDGDTITVFTEPGFLWLVCKDT
jgi:endonuclease YncB( thermonuclease family)